jgi:hypothetical protein
MSRPYALPMIESQEDWDRRMAGIDDQLVGYEQAINDYAKFMREWKARQPKGFRGRKDFEGAA